MWSLGVARLAPRLARATGDSGGPGTPNLIDLARLAAAASWTGSELGDLRQRVRSPLDPKRAVIGKCTVLQSLECTKALCARALNRKVIGTKSVPPKQMAEKMKWKKERSAANRGRSASRARTKTP